MSRHIPIRTLAKCTVCRRPVELIQVGESAMIFEPGRGSQPHRCPEDALIRFRALLRFARMGDPRFSGKTVIRGQN
jgi:hypothetical protein